MDVLSEARSSVCFPRQLNCQLAVVPRQKACIRPQWPTLCVRPGLLLTAHAGADRTVVLPRKTAKEAGAAKLRQNFRHTGQCSSHEASLAIKTSCSHGAPRATQNAFHCSSSFAGPRIRTARRGPRSGSSVSYACNGIVWPCWHHHCLPLPQPLPPTDQP